MKIRRIDEAVEACREHLERSSAFNSEVEIFLTRYLMVLMCASFEEKIKELVNVRARDSNDKAIISFVSSALDRLVRSVKSGEIAGLLGRFGEQYKNRFQMRMKEAEVAEMYFNNIVVNRHDTAHSRGSNVTFSELVKFYDEGHVVLDAFEEALSVPDQPEAE
ncbi:hypothetical protein KKA69_05000 [Patescibacteria group bacterium]|nr:hypothetical protein [Patescibacteria group bacterium]